MWLMFTELLDNEFFEAGSLVTKWPSECIWVEENYEVQVSPGIIEDAERKKISNLVVSSDDKPVGFVPVHVVKQTLVLKEKSVKKGIPWIQSDLKLIPLVKILSDKGARGSPLFFVRDNSLRTIGILNYSDLNRKSVYLYSYTMLLFLEHWIRDTIRRKKCSMDESLNFVCIEELLKLSGRGNIHKTRYEEIVSRVQTRGQHHLVACDLKDLCYILQKDPVLGGAKRELTPVTIDFASTFLRNRIAHPNNLIIPNCNADRNLADLLRILS